MRRLVPIVQPISYPKSIHFEVVYLQANLFIYCLCKAQVVYPRARIYCLSVKWGIDSRISSTCIMFIGRIVYIVSADITFISGVAFCHEGALLSWGRGHIFYWFNETRIKRSLNRMIEEGYFCLLSCLFTFYLFLIPPSSFLSFSIFRLLTGGGISHSSSIINKK